MLAILKEVFAVFLSLAILFPGDYLGYYMTASFKFIIHWSILESVVK
jgi:hypothetical protein